MYRQIALFDILTQLPIKVGFRRALRYKSWRSRRWGDWLCGIGRRRSWFWRWPRWSRCRIVLYHSTSIIQNKIIISDLICNIPRAYLSRYGPIKVWFRGSLRYKSRRGWWRRRGWCCIINRRGLGLRWRWWRRWGRIVLNHSSSAIEYQVILRSLGGYVTHRYQCLHTPGEIWCGFILREDFVINLQRSRSLLLWCTSIRFCNIIWGRRWYLFDRLRGSIVGDEGSGGIKHIRIVLLRSTYIPLAHGGEHLPIEVGDSLIFWCLSTIWVASRLLGLYLLCGRRILSRLWLSLIGRLLDDGLGIFNNSSIFVDCIGSIIGWPGQVPSRYGAQHVPLTRCWLGCLWLIRGLLLLKWAIVGCWGIASLICNRRIASSILPRSICIVARDRYGLVWHLRDRPSICNLCSRLQGLCRLVGAGDVTSLDVAQDAPAEVCL